MAQTNTMTMNEERQSLNLNLYALKSVNWVESNPLYLYGVSVTKQPITRARQFRIIDFICSIIYFQITLISTLIHSVPWPASVIKVIHRADEFVEHVLDVVFQKLEWWWDYLSIKCMRLMETLIGLVDKVITFLDGAINWLATKCSWLVQLAMHLYETGKTLFDWVMSVYSSIRDYINSLLHNIQVFWKESKEEVKMMEQISTSNQREFSCDEISVKSDVTTKRLSFTTDDDNIKIIRRSSRLSDSEMSDVAEVQETTKQCMGEKTGVPYNRVTAEAVVVGKTREEMYQRVTGKLKVMRKNSIRFSRGVDVKVSRFIASVQRQVTPQSVASMILSLIKYILRIPSQFIMWLVGAKKPNKRSRSMRNESSTLVGATMITTQELSPSEIKQSTEPTPEYVETPVIKNSLPAESKIPVTVPKYDLLVDTSEVYRRDSGVSDDYNHESSEEMKGKQITKPLKIGEKFDQLTQVTPEKKIAEQKRKSIDDILFETNPLPTPTVEIKFEDHSSREEYNLDSDSSSSGFKSGQKSLESIPDSFSPKVIKSGYVKKQVKILDTSKSKKVTDI